MEKEDKEPKAPKVTRSRMVENSKAKFYANITQNYKDNENAPVLKAPTKPTPPAKDMIKLNKEKLAAKAKDVGAMRAGSGSQPARKPSATFTKSSATNKTRLTTEELDKQKRQGSATGTARVPSRGPTPLTKATNPRN